MHPRATHVFELARKTGRMQRRLQLLPIADVQKELGFQGRRHMASKPQATQMSRKRQSTYHLHSMPRTLPPCHPSEEDGGKKTKEGNSPCSSLELGHNFFLVTQLQKMAISVRRLAKKKVTLLHLGTDCESSELYLGHRAVRSQQPAAHPSSSDLQMLLIYLHGSLYNPHRNSNS